MDQKFRLWKLAIERFWQDPAADCREIAQLVAEMAGNDDIALRQAAAQALPSLRHAVAKKSDRTLHEIARRRLRPVHDALHTLTAPQFGKRGLAPKALTPEERYRQILGLPLGRRLAPAEIRQAYKQAAKNAHPDRGGNGPAFRELAAARDALMKHR